MRKIGFSNEKYIELQSKHIKERIKQFDNKLYLEFGGKLFDDHHASRVLPGFEPDSKLKMLLELKQDAEIIIVINANDIENNKMRGDLGITYDLEVLRLIDAFQNIGLYVGSVTITRFENQVHAIAFQKKLENLGIKVFRHYPIAGYPNDIEKIVSEEGFGINDYIETTKPLVVVTAPGPGSGKMATCLSQLYHEYTHGIKAGYAKFETFPIWNIPLKHPVNLAYEAATADLNDVNMIDPFHLEAYNETTVNYNRDVEIFPVLESTFKKIMSTCPYKSPTDMGVNMAGNAIIDDEACKEASKQEIIRRYYQTKLDFKRGLVDKSAISKIEAIMLSLALKATDRKCVNPALEIEEQTNEPGFAIELNDGHIITGKTTSLLGSASACLLNALKYLANIDDDILLIEPEVIEPVSKLKKGILKNKNPRLHTDEVLLSLSISANNNENAKKALSCIEQLQYCEAHSSVILSETDIDTLKRLGIRLTSEDKFQFNRIYQNKPILAYFFNVLNNNVNSSLFLVFLLLFLNKYSFLSILFLLHNNVDVNI